VSGQSGGVKRDGDVKQHNPSLGRSMTRKRYVNFRAIDRDTKKKTMQEATFAITNLP